MRNKLKSVEEVESTLLKSYKRSANQHIFIVVKTPSVMRELVEGGVPIKQVNVGNMHAREGKRQYHESHVYVDDADLADFEAIKARGAEVYIQVLPNDKKIAI